MASPRYISCCGVKRLKPGASCSGGGAGHACCWPQTAGTSAVQAMVTARSLRLNEDPCISFPQNGPILVRVSHCRSASPADCEYLFQNQNRIRDGGLLGYFSPAGSCTFWSTCR